MNWTTDIMDLNNDQARTRNIGLNQFTVRGGNSSYESIKQSSSTNLIATVFCFYFSDPFLMEGFLHYIAPAGPSWSYTCWSFEPLLEYLSHQTPPWLSVSCGSQSSTVQGSSPRKCGQRSSCSAFNVVIVAFPKIFLNSHHHGTFMIHIPVTRASSKITLIIKIFIWYVFSLSEEIFLLEPPSQWYLAH